MSSYLALPLFQAFLSLILLVIVLRSKSQDISRYLFAFYLGGLLTWGILIFFMRSSPNLETAYFWEKLLLPLGLLLSVIIYHFSVIFSGLRLKKRFISLGYIGFGIALILSEIGWVVAGMQLKSYGYAPVPGPLFLVVALIMYALVVAAIVNIWKYSRKALFNEEKTRSIYILIGMIISVLGGVFDVLPLLGLAPYPGVIIGNILFCIITSIAILKYHLMGIQVIARKISTYILASVIVSLPYLVTILIFERVIRSPVPLWVFVGLFILTVIILQPLWHSIQSLVEKAFYRSRYDFMKELDDFSRKTHPIGDITATGNSLVRLVERALQSSNVYLFLPSIEGIYNLVFSARGTQLSNNTFSYNPVLNWLRLHKTVLRRLEMSYIAKLQSLTREEMEAIETLDADVFVPVLDKENEMVGILVLGPKSNHQPYSEEDEQLILSVTHRLALKLENARLYSLEAMARQELQKQNDLKTEFLHSAAHELKTPLTAIISSSEMLMEKLSVTGDNLGQRLAVNINTSALSMNRRVSELLDFARVQIGTLEMNKQELDLNLLAQDMVSKLSPLFSSRQQQLNLETHRVAPVKADKDKLEQVFTNLLSNANKYSPKNSRIILRTRQQESSVIVEVEDSAPLISDDDKRKLFTPYYRGEDPELRQRTPGLGLGLAISKKIIEMHDGKIWVDRNPGIGNIFAFSLAVTP